MKKSVLIFVMLLTIPQIALAAWWNPSTWKMFKRTDNQTQILEKRIKDLENKLNSSTSTPETAIRASSTMNDKSIQDKKEIPASISPSVNKISPTTLNPSSVSSGGISYEKLVTEYTDLKNQMEKDFNNLSKNSVFESERDYRIYLERLLTSTNSDLGYLLAIQNFNPRPNINYAYALKLSKLNNEYIARQKTYKLNIEKDRVKYEAEAPQREKAAADEARKSSPECVDAKQLLADINSQIEPLQLVQDKRYDEYIRTGTYITKSLSSDDSNKLTNLILRKSGAQTKYYYLCEGFVPSSPTLYTTDCYNLGNSTTCYTQ